jgi:hypothetical protein
MQQPRMLSKVTPRSASDLWSHWELIKKNMAMTQKVRTEDTNPQGNRGMMTLTSRDDVIHHRHATRKTDIASRRHDSKSWTTHHDGAVAANPWSHDVSGHDGSDLDVMGHDEVTGAKTSRLHGDDDDAEGSSSRGVYGMVLSQGVSRSPRETLIVNVVSSSGNGTSSSTSGNDRSFTSGNDTSFTSGNITSFTSGNGVDSERPRSVRTSPSFCRTRNDIDPFFCPKQEEAIIAGTTTSVPPEALQLRTRDSFQGPFERAQRSVRTEEDQQTEEDRQTCAHPRQDERATSETPTRPSMSREPQVHPWEHETAEDKLRRLGAELKCAMELAGADRHSQHQHKGVVDVIRPARGIDNHPTRRSPFGPFETEATNGGVRLSYDEDGTQSSETKSSLAVLYFRLVLLSCVL